MVKEGASFALQGSFSLTLREILRQCSSKMIFEEGQSILSAGAIALLTLSPESDPTKISGLVTSAFTAHKWYRVECTLVQGAVGTWHCACPSRCGGYFPQNYVSINIGPDLRSGASIWLPLRSHW